MSFIELSSLNGSNGFALNGINRYDYSGSSVSSAGDVNGDGFADLLIGASSASPTGVSSGQSYVVFGKRTGFEANLNLSTLNGSNGFVLNGINGYDYSGSSVSSAGDVNGDGFADLLIGAANADPNGINSGQSYVVFGKRTGFGASLNLSTLNGSNGFALNGVNVYDRSGYSISSVGDINGDGFADLLIGASYADPNGNNSGQSYVVFGKRTGFGASLNLSSLNGSNGFAINGVNAFDRSGRSVSSAGDVNGDGLADLIIGASYADPNGLSYSGQSYVVFGKRTGFEASLNLSTLNGSNGFALNGVNAFDRSGRSVSSAGDVNGDGFADLLIGASSANPNGNRSGRSYVVFGRRTGFGASLNLSSLNGSNGFALNGTNAFDYSGYSVSSAGDVNGDGLADLLIGAPSADPNARNASGKSYIVFGRRTGFGASLNLSTLDGSNGFALNGINAFDYSGKSVSSAGDVNGDGFADLLIGAPSADPNTRSASGQSYVVFGRSSGGSTLPTITLAVSPVSVTEDGTGNLIYTLTRTGNLTNPLTVNYTVGGTATNGTDYATIGTSVNFAANSGTAQVTVNPTPDTIVEPDETVSVTIASNAAYTIGTTTPVIGTIINDDNVLPLPRITLAISPVSVTEDGTGNLIYTLTRTGNLTNPLTVNYTVGGTATNGTDYATIGTSVNFPANLATAQVTVNPTPDTIVEANETVSVTIASNAAYTIGTTTPVIGTVNNDDADNNGNTLAGGPGNDNLNGLGGNDNLSGLGGNDTLIGGAGNDQLYGGTGLDHFVFNSANDRLDTIHDFVVTDDTIDVSRTGFGAGLVGGILPANQFVISTGATVPSHRFIYNNANGGLFFDADGTGGTAQTQIARLSIGLAMTHADFMVI